MALRAAVAEDGFGAVQGASIRVVSRRALGGFDSQGGDPQRHGRLHHSMTRCLCTLRHSSSPSANRAKQVDVARPRS